MERLAALNVTVDSYGWKAADGPDSCGYIAPAILKILSELGPKRVLDLGCGNGALAAAMSNAGYQVVGIDADSEGIALARKAVPAARFEQIDFSHDPRVALRGELPFDAVVSTEVIEHLFSPHQLPEFAAKVLPEGGRLVISTPYHGYLKNLALSLFGAWDRHFTALWHGGHIKFWSPRTLVTLLRERGFEFESFHGVGRFPYLWKSMIIVARRRGSTNAAPRP